MTTTTTTCKACGKPFRKGVLAFLLTPSSRSKPYGLVRGGLTGARVCQSCAAGGVLLVAPKLPPVVKQKTVRSDGVERAIRSMRIFATSAKASSNPGNEHYLQGRAEGFEGSIEILKRECGE